MARYPKHYVGEAITKVEALVKSGHRPVSAYQVVGKDMGVTPSTVKRWYDNRATKPRTTKPGNTTGDNVVKAFRRHLDADGFDQVAAAKNAPDPTPTLADYAGQYEAVSAEIPQLEERLATLKDRRELLRKTLTEALKEEF